MSNLQRVKVKKSNSAPHISVQINHKPVVDQEDQFLRKKISKYDVLKVRVWLEDHFFIFSRYLVSRILTFNNIPIKDSVRIAMDLKKLLVEEEKFDVQQSEMENYLFQLMQNYNYGEAFIRRYKTLNQFNSSRSPLLVLVAGAPACGKSRLVTQLADRINVANILQTDIVANVMSRLNIISSNRPFWAQSEKSQIQHYQNECLYTRQGVQTDIVKCLQEGKALIIEGTQLDPTLYLEQVEQGTRRYRISIPDLPEQQFQQIRKQLDALDQSSAVIVPFLLTISEQDHAYTIENWLMSKLPESIAEEVEKIGNLKQQLQWFLRSFQQVQQYLLEYNDIFTVIPLNIQNIDETLKMMHNVILARIETLNARN